jgi:hypothetical protein
MKYHLTCEQFIQTLETNESWSVADVCADDSAWDFELNYYADRDGDMYVITDSDTEDKIIIKDPENMDVEY